MMHLLNPFQWIFVPVLSVLFLYNLILLVRGTRWRGAAVRAILWLSVTVTLLRPGITITVARALGIGRGADLVLYVFIIGSLGAVLYFYGRVVKLESAITVLVRHVALQDKANTKPGS